MASTTPPRIAIIGAGPAGLTLALLLQQAPTPISITVFESDPSPFFRSQGGTLDLHPSTGQAALKACGLYEEFEKCARYDGEALKVMDKYMTVFISHAGGTKESSNGRPEIDRAELRRILVEGYGQGNVRWGVRISGVEEEKEGKWAVLLKDGGREGPFDLVVGADGAWSHVRKELSGAKPVFAGLGGFTGVVKDVHETHPDLAALVERGSIFSFSDGTGLVLQQKGDGSMSVSAWCHKSEDWMTQSGLNIHDSKAVKDHLQDQFKDWKHPLGKAPLVTDNDDLKATSLYVLPVGHRWEGRKGLTLLGDAAHLTSPFAGEGVNLAMTDAMELAQALTEGLKIDDLHKNIRAFELEMFARATPIQALSTVQGDLMFFTPGAPRTTIAEWIRNALAGPYFDRWWLKLLLPQWLILGILKLVYRI